MRTRSAHHPGRTRVPNAEHEAQAWLIRSIAPDFRLIDVWALPMEGAHDEFQSALDVMASVDPMRSGSRVSRALFALRLQAGRWLDWDTSRVPQPIPGRRETTLAARLPRDLVGSAADPRPVTASAFGFRPLYRTEREWAAELANATVHGVLQLVWVRDGGDRCRAHMGVYVKPRGALGHVYLALIEPFRHLVVYPALLRQIGRAWQGRMSTSPR